jgi:hypothetical protein
MNTKSAIQLVTEALIAKEAFKQHLTELNERYNIINNVFTCDQNYNAIEAKKGYYVEESTHETLDEAIKNCNIYIQGIRVHEGKYSVGTIYNRLCDAKGDVIIDLSNAQML